MLETRTEQVLCCRFSFDIDMELWFFIIYQQSFHHVSQRLRVRCITAWRIFFRMFFCGKHEMLYATKLQMF